MKKILTKEQQKKKDKINQLIIGIVLIALMLFSTVGYALSGNESKETTDSIDYNGITFTKNSEYWNFNYQGLNLNTRYNPQEVSDIQVPILFKLQDYKQEPLYFIGELNSPALEIIRVLDNIALRINNACLPNTNCTGNYPIKNPSIDNLLIIQEPSKNQTEKIYQQENAVFIIASQENQDKYADAFLFKILQI